MDDLDMVLLARDTDCMGYHVPGVVAVCAWDASLWWDDMCPEWYAEHADLLERLGVDVRKRGRRLVVAWTEEQARAFQLLHILLHELGHHRDRMTTRTKRRASRGEPYAESFAAVLEARIWDDFVRVFPL